MSFYMIVNPMAAVTVMILLYAELGVSALAGIAYVIIYLIVTSSMKPLISRYRQVTVLTNSFNMGKLEKNRQTHTHGIIKLEFNH